MTADNKQPLRIKPSQRLLIAIVRRAIWDFALYKDCPEGSPQYALAEDAAGWLFWDGQEECDESGRYTFCHICVLLDINPEQVRKHAVGLSKKELQRLNNNIKDR